MAVTPADIARTTAVARDCFDAAENALNAADGKLGDGDTGTMLKRMTGKLAETDLGKVPDAADAFRALAMAASSATGSSLGTLVMTALMLFAKESRAAGGLEAADLPRLLKLAAEAMLARGGAKPGDKTVIDGLLAVADATGEVAPDAIAATARDAARAALDRFRDQPNLIGRAGRYGDRSRGLDDPGMLALALLCDALAAPPRET